MVQPILPLSEQDIRNRILETVRSSRSGALPTEVLNKLRDGRLPHRRLGRIIIEQMVESGDLIVDYEWRLRIPRRP